MCKWGTDRAVTISQVVMVDACLADEVAWLNGRGVRTLASCCGHGKEAGSIVIEPADERIAKLLGYESEQVPAEQVEQREPVVIVRPRFRGER